MYKFISITNQSQFRKTLLGASIMVAFTISGCGGGGGDDTAQAQSSPQEAGAEAMAAFTPPDSGVPAPKEMKVLVLGSGAGEVAKQTEALPRVTDGTHTLLIVSADVADQPQAQQAAKDAMAAGVAVIFDVDSSGVVTDVTRKGAQSLVGFESEEVMMVQAVPQDRGGGFTVTPLELSKSATNKGRLDSGAQATDNSVANVLGIANGGKQ